MEKGDKVVLLKQSGPHLTGRRPVPIGARGVVLAVRQLPGDCGQQSLVKYVGFSRPRHTPTGDAAKVHMTKKEEEAWPGSR